MKFFRCLPIRPKATTSAVLNIFDDVVVFHLFSALLLIAGNAVQPAAAADNAARETPVVLAIRAVEPSIVSLFVVRDGSIGAGSGTILHPAGLVLTNNHVVPVDEGFALVGGTTPNQQKPKKFKVWGRYPERDLAIVRLLDSADHAAAVTSSSADLMNGETVIVAGNPGGRGLAFTSGIISATSVLAGAPNALVMTNYKVDHRPRFIQFDAASNGGNSGGPLININGQVVGVVSEKIYQEQNVGFAIPIDAVYQLIKHLVEPELRSGSTTGISVAAKAGPAVIQSIAADSAAQEAQLRVGDVITSLNKYPVRHTIDWNLQLSLILGQNKPISLTVLRDGTEHSVTLRPQPAQPWPAISIEDTQLVAGLRYEMCHGQFSLLPDFAKQTIVGTGVVQSVELAGVQRKQNDYFAVAFTGFVKVPEDGVYRLTLQSDDGSRMWLNDQLLIDNDGNHPPLGVGRMAFLQGGLHSVRIEYFQGNGGAELGLTIRKAGDAMPESEAAVSSEKPTATAFEYFHQAAPLN